MPEYHWINEQTWTVEGFYSTDECRDHIAFAEELGFVEAPVSTKFGEVMRKDIRDNQRVLRDDPQLAEELWPRVRDYVPTRLGPWTAFGVNERFRYYRYEDGQQFDWHLDGYYRPDEKTRSQITVLIYLNADFEGGATSFDDFEINPQPGLLLLFRHAQRHKGQPVTSGRKYVLRTDVMYALNAGAKETD